MNHYRIVNSHGHVSNIKADYIQVSTSGVVAFYKRNRFKGNELAGVVTNPNSVEKNGGC